MARRGPFLNVCERLFHRLLRMAVPVLAVCMTACGPRGAGPAPDAPVALTLTTDDGAVLSATYYPAPSSLSCGVVLVHDSGGSAAQWSAFARRLQQSGIASIAFDMRGHGASTGPEGRQVSHQEFEASDWLRAVFDIQAARNALTANGVDPENLGIVGAGMGANLATHYAARDETIEALVLISPGLEYGGVTIRKAFEAYTMRPSLLIATKGDTYAASSAQTLKRSASTFCDLREYAGGAHGMDVVDSLAGVREELVFWLESILKTSKRGVVTDNAGG